MSSAALTSRLDRAVDNSDDHILGSPNAALTLVEYGSYACPYCRAANEEIAALRDQFGDRLRYVFRHRPLTGNDLARRAAELAEQATDPEEFWRVHIALMTRSGELTEEDLTAVAADAGLTATAPEAENEAANLARRRVEQDESSSRASGVKVTPTFFINGRRYDGPWDRTSLSDALLGRLGHRVNSAALDFASWGPSAGLLLFVATVLAVALANSPMGPQFEAFWERPLSISFGGAAFSLSLRDWINDGLLTIFFLVVGLEIKREFTVGHLASRRAAALPIAAAIGGMAVPMLIYLLIIPSGPWAHGWGVPMATDTAFAIALIVVLGDRVPVALRIFLTAAAIVDDIGAILVVAVFYAGDLHLQFLALAAVFIAGLALLSRAHVYRVSLYILLGLGLWIAVHESGLHATLSGVILALFIPTRPAPNFMTLATQADTILKTETARGEQVLRHGPSLASLRALDAIHDRLESPADRLLRYAGARSSYIVLPLFAFANAGVALQADVFAGHETLLLAIMAAMIVGKPVGLFVASLLAVWLGLATKPDAYSWRQLAGAGALAGIGFTMSLFIASEAFPAPSDFAAAKIAVLSASVLSALFGVALLWGAETPSEEESRTEQEGQAVSQVAA
jgi:NhaA family Na+:H+ antiporter